MDWTIYSGDDLIYDRDIVADNGVRPYEVYNPIMTETTSGFCHLTFTATDDSAAANHVKTLFPHIKLYNGANLYWVGRCLSDDPNIKGEHEYYIEDFLGVLNDSIMPPYEFFGTVPEFIELLVSKHNDQVAESQKFSAVVCDVESQFETGNISRSSESYAKTWSVIKDKLINMLGGYIWVSYDAEEQPVLHYSMSPRDTATQTIELRENLASLSIKNNAGKFYTACMPLGKQDEATKKHLTIGSVNDGVDTLMNEEAAAEFGIIYAPLEDTTWPDVTLPENLLARGLEWMREQSAQAVQEISLDAVDDGEGEPLYWLDGVRVIAEERGLDAVFVITSMSRNLKKPRTVSITLNYSGRTITTTMASATASNTRVINEIRADYVTTGEARSIVESEIRNSTWIEQRANAIVAGALQEFVQTGDFATLQQQVATEFSLLAGEISLNFTTLSEQITQQGANINATLAQYAAWFRFLSYGLVIGNSGSPIQMVLKNDILFFCTDPDTVTEATAIAYFAAGKLYVNFINVNNLTIGVAGKWLDVRIVGTGDNTCALFSGRLG